MTARPIVSRVYALKRRYGVGDRFLARHDRVTHALMGLLQPLKQSSVVDAHGHILEVDPGDYLGLTINRTYESEVTQFLQERVRSGQVVVDLGANIGYFTLLLAKLVGPRGHVVAFEPDPTTFRLLERNVRENGYTNVVLHRQAVADRCGSALLYLNPDNPGDHRLVDGADRESVEVDVISIDEALPELRTRISWVKMDIQGAELAALRGMRTLLGTNREMGIVMEFCPRALADFGEQPEEVFELLEGSGFTPHVLSERDGSPATSAAKVLARVTAVGGTYINLAFVKEPRVSPAHRGVTGEDLLE
jgi:FkbM family methyltransferase